MKIIYYEGLWRRIESGKIRSFATYSDALENESCWEENDSYCSETFDKIHLLPN